MYKKFILILSFLTFSISYGQYDWTPGKLVLKNGQTLKGLIKLPSGSNSFISMGKSKLQFKKNKKSSKKKFGETQVNKVFFFGISNSEIGYYEYVAISRKRKALFKLIINGKAKLYTRTVRVTTNIGFQDKDNLYGQSRYAEVKEFYVIRERETVATRLIGSKSLNSFKQHALNYFSDCKDLSSYISDDLYEEYDIRELINDYNILCN
ncbi:hypothetical protein MNBD_BACTEROID02-243 [hydrothermal vent metagenome]|uniref:Uncharacterized protein n=1 Tax=hydrothermal vent metagenome TaxID=652676 RepID=A0A3B0R3H4_9ZZZZ